MPLDHAPASPDVSPSSDAPSPLRLYDDGRDLVVAADRGDVRAILCEQYPCFDESDGDTPEALAAFRVVPDDEVVEVPAEDTEEGAIAQPASWWVAQHGRGLLHSRAFDDLPDADEEG